MRLPTPFHAFATAALLAGVVEAAHAQAYSAGTQTSFASRSQLEALARVADSAARALPAGSEERATREVEAMQLRRRLEQGDFTAGDRIAVRVEGQAALTDTFTVRAGARLQLPGMPELSLAGVLRSEVEGRLREEIARFIREPYVQVTPLLRVVVSGAVLRPGFYALPADAPLSDAVMSAGGPSADGDLGRVELRRGPTKLYRAGEFSAAVRKGVTLDQAHLLAGDEIVVGLRKRQNWTTILQAATVGLGIVTLALTLSRN